MQWPNYIAMNQLNYIDLSNYTVENTPFPHFSCTSVLNPEVASELYQWFEQTENWNLAEEEFYTQYEFVLSKTELPQNLEWLINDDTIGVIKKTLKQTFKIKVLETISVVVHKLVDGHTIGIHNDFINREETHRLVIQINPFWQPVNGGFLMLFNSSNPQDVSKIIQPINNSAFGFEITDKSFHAVSTVRNFSRYSIIYTFKEKKA